MEHTHFSLDTAHPRYVIWGLGQAERFYFSEWLPAFFSRTLTFSALPPESSFSWIFTGERGRVEIRYENKTLALAQYYTDSFALYPFDPEKQAGQVSRHPEKCWKEDSVSVQSLPSLTLTYDSHLRLTVFSGEALLLSQRCTLDLNRHQLSVSGQNCFVEGDLILPDMDFASPASDSSCLFQKIEGFGGIASTPSYHMLSEKGKSLWWKYVEEYQLLIQREYPNRGSADSKTIPWDDPSRAVPHYYGNNFPVGETSDFNYNRKILELGGCVWFEFWLYPDSSYEERELNVQTLVSQILDYCRQSEKAGQPPSVVGIQNERCESAETLEKLVPLLRRSLDENGFEQVKLSTCNASFLKEGLTYLERFQHSRQVWESMDYTASNMYDYQICFADLEEFLPVMRQFHEKSKGLPFLSTEIAVNHCPFQEDSYHLAFNLGVFYHYNLTVLNACALCYCWTLMDVTEPSYGFTRTLFTVDAAHGFLPVPSGYILRTFGAFSRHIQKNMRRIQVSCSVPGILCSGYSDGTDGYVYLFLNQNTRNCVIQTDKLEGSGKGFQAELCDPYHENDAVPCSAEIQLPAGALLTLYTRKESFYE